MKPSTIAVSALVAAALASSLACGPGVASRPATQPTTRSFEVRVAGVDDPFVPADPFNTPAAGTRYVAARLEIVNVSTETHTIEPAVDFKLIGRLGIAYDVAVLVSQPGDVSTGGPALGLMPPGASLQGLLPFQVPLSDTPEILRFDGPGGTLDTALTGLKVDETEVPTPG